MAARGSFARLLLLCVYDWLMGRTLPKTSFEVQLPSGAEGGAGGGGGLLWVSHNRERSGLLTWLS